MQKIYFNYFLVFAVLFFLLFAPLALAQDLQVPKGFDWNAVPKALQEALNSLIGALKAILSRIVGVAKNLFLRLNYYLNKEVENRRPQAEQEFKKEVQEIKDEIKEEAPSVWQRLKNILK